MPGGDKASTEPWRMGVSYLYKYYGKDFLNLNIPFVKNLDLKKTELLLQGIDAGINSPLTSSCGRLFDAVAAICGISHQQDYEAQAAMQLEALIEKDWLIEIDPITMNEDKTIRFEDAIKGIVDSIGKKFPIGIISAVFHNTVSESIIGAVKNIRENYHINTVALSGGCFQNRYLLQRTIRRLTEDKFRVLTHKKVPANDGGISLGQLAIGAHLIKEE